MDNCILELKDLKKYYGKIRGIEDVSLKLHEGEIFGFIGPNGAGKSTTIRSIMGLINITDGKILINGKELDRDDIETRKMIGYLPSDVHLYEDYIVKELLDYHESFYGRGIHKNRKELVKLFEIEENKKIEDLSLGNLKKVGIVLALMHKPKLLILDEPTNGLDPLMQNVLNDVLKKEKERGTTIFYSTHILSEVSKICDRVGIIKEGRLIKIESIEELSKKNLLSVSIKSNDIEKIKKELDIDSPVNNSSIKFTKNIDINNLIKTIDKYRIDKLLIEETTIEDMFLHYYK